MDHSNQLLSCRLLKDWVTVLSASNCTEAASSPQLDNWHALHHLHVINICYIRPTLPARRGMAQMLLITQLMSAESADSNSRAHSLADIRCFHL